MNKRQTVLRESESGAALIAVLVLIAAVTLLVMNMATISQLATFGTRSDAARLRSMYVAEGALNRITYLLAADTSVYNTTDMDGFDYSEYDEERYLPDGVDRTLDYYGTPVRYRIENGAGGLSVDNGISDALSRLTSVRAENEEALSEQLEIFSNRYNDYTDSDDTAADDDGMEEAEYEDRNAEPLPRNGTLYIREELWWIPDGFQLFPPNATGRLTLIHPLGTGVTDNKKPDLYQANFALLTNHAGLEASDAREVLRAIKEFRKERTVLSESIDEELYLSLKNYFSTTNSGIFRITIERAAAPGSVSARMDAVFDNPGIGSSTETTVNFFDWMIY